MTRLIKRGKTRSCLDSSAEKEASSIIFGYLFFLKFICSNLMCFRGASLSFPTPIARTYFHLNLHEKIFI